MNPSVGKIFWRRKWQPTLVFLLGKFHGQRSLGGYSPRDHPESDTTEHPHVCVPMGLGVQAWIRCPEILGIQRKRQLAENLGYFSYAFLH